jgi:Zn-dependent M28 family amino/carboxypeptidase
VGVIPGRRSDEFVLFTAHHDHVGVGRPQDGDSIYNGANDDASGVTAVIALARYFKQLRRPERTLVFATFTGEESGGFGSQYLSRQLDPDQIVAMFNIEMIGKAGVENPTLVWITGFAETDFGEILQTGMEQDAAYSFGADPYPDQNLFYRSDNAVFARLSVPAHSISTTSMNSDEDYHQASDEFETLDIGHMTATIQAIARGAMPIVSGDATPTRVDTAGLN